VAKAAAVSKVSQWQRGQGGVPFQKLTAAVSEIGAAKARGRFRIFTAAAKTPGRLRSFTEAQAAAVSERRRLSGRGGARLAKPDAAKVHAYAAL
jgi:hypothetical protein